MKLEIGEYRVQTFNNVFFKFTYNYCSEINDFVSLEMFVETLSPANVSIMKNSFSIFIDGYEREIFSIDEVISCLKILYNGSLYNDYEKLTDEHVDSIVAYLKTKKIPLLDQSIKKQGNTWIINESHLPLVS